MLRNVQDAHRYIVGVIPLFRNRLTIRDSEEQRKMRLDDLEFNEELKELDDFDGF